jgi:hypothetical protein
MLTCKCGPSVRQQNRHGRACKHPLSGSSEDKFSHPRVPVRPHYQKIGIPIRQMSFKHITDAASLGIDFVKYHIDTMPRQVLGKLRTRPSSVERLFLGYGENTDAFRFSKIGIASAKISQNRDSQVIDLCGVMQDLCAVRISEQEHEALVILPVQRFYRQPSQGSPDADRTMPQHSVKDLPRRAMGEQATDFRGLGRLEMRQAERDQMHSRLTHLEQVGEQGGLGAHHGG